MAASLDPNLAYRYCLRLARSHPENFFVGSILLPRRLRCHVATVYAYARIADDLADGDLPVSEKLSALDVWEQALEDCARGVAIHPVFVALAETLREHDLPLDPFRNLLRAFRYDSEFRPFDTFEDLLSYCRNSADPVGRLILALFGVRDEECDRLSDRICTALQLTNFWQDLGRDLPRGRLYLPLEDLDRFGVTRAALAEGDPPRRLPELVRFEVERTRELFAEGAPLAARLSGRLSREVRMFAAGGVAILDRIEAGRFAPIEERPSLSTADRLRLLATGLVGARAC